MIKETLNAIEMALKPISDIKYINEDWGQIDYYTQPPVLFPCVLLDCEAVDYTTMGGNLQKGDGIITIRIADFRNLQQANVRATTTEPRYEFFELIDKIHTVLQGLSSVAFTPLDRRGLNRARRDDAIREFRLTYKFSFKDGAAVKERMQRIVPPKIETGIEKQQPKN